MGLLSSLAEVRAEGLRFPPLWQEAQPDDDEADGWQREGSCSGGLQNIMNEARRCFALQGWTLRHQTDIKDRPSIRLLVWRRNREELYLLLHEVSVAQWAFSAGIKPRETQGE